MRSFLLLTIIALLVCSVSVTAQVARPKVPRDFRSDNCTLFPNGNYADCCIAHDEDYYFGGTWKQRWRSDKRLFKCVSAKGGWRNKWSAGLMWVGVRVGGVPFLPTPFRWGFGRSKRPNVIPPVGVTPK